MKKNNFEKLYQIALNTHEEMMKMFTTREIEAINKGKCWVVYALDRLFSGWGKSNKKSNHVFVICWSHEQEFNIKNSLENAHEMSYVSSCSVDYFVSKKNRHGTWSIKNANDCAAWNKGLEVKI